LLNTITGNIAISEIFFQEIIQSYRSIRQTSEVLEDINHTTINLRKYGSKGVAQNSGST